MYGTIGNQIEAVAWFLASYIINVSQSVRYSSKNDSLKKFLNMILLKQEFYLQFDSCIMHFGIKQKRFKLVSVYIPKYQRRLIFCKLDAVCICFFLLIRYKLMKKKLFYLTIWSSWDIQLTCPRNYIVFQQSMCWLDVCFQLLLSQIP